MPLKFLNFNPQEGPNSRNSCGILVEMLNSLKHRNCFEIVIFSSQIQAGKEFKLGNFFPVWILSRSEFDYWQQLFDAQGFHQSTENTFHPILSSSVSKALKKWLEGRWFKPTLFQNFYEKLFKFLMVCLHGWWGKAWALKITIPLMKLFCLWNLSQAELGRWAEKLMSFELSWAGY